MLVYAQQGDTLDLLCYRHLGRTAGVVENAFIANPGLADPGDILPHGQAVLLPDSVTQTSAKKTLIQLWD